MAACFRYLVNDVDAAIAFYTQRLGFKLEMHPAPPFAEISRGDMHLYLTQPQGQGAGGGRQLDQSAHESGLGQIVRLDQHLLAPRQQVDGGRDLLDRVRRDGAVRGAGHEELLSPE